MIREKEMESVAQFVNGDAFDRRSLGGRHAAAHAGRRLRAVRVVPRQCADP